MILNEGGISINWQKCCMIPVALTPGMEGSLEDPWSLDLGNANIPIPLPGVSHGFGEYSSYSRIYGSDSSDF